ncbi:PorP/SprF family type IX secretion system membrane protein [Cochleicola gelatinilyticus]|uniref:SPOR domain-containing protein n=1 Tax=Cochleicola gelatinilyticus TaxID=1763537 RepID=A0A167GXM4_9FLAO|nr:PorP/SprF family type IX secretion system membrane protein [Cochleicola gelatinilyticus]OAB78013.1 hypothetical protein ULVI_11040 [Cochleicola gelatinilyticus]
MKTVFIPILIFFCTLQMIYSQSENGVVALDIPVRNSLMFNRFIANPTFSFVREPNMYIALTNKRELLELEDAPQTFLGTYSGRFGENVGAGIGLFQQNYGVFTTFGGLLNVAYNIRLQEDSNLTFGINAGAYNSGLNNGKVVTNFDDPALENIPSNFSLTASPSFNYGTGFMDFGITLHNIVTYNFQTSGIIKENPEQGIQGHLMYTGYLGGYGFFGESKFTALGKTEFQKDNTILSGTILLTVPKGIWAQASYNTIYGASGGLGINITPQIAIEYQYEKAFMGLSDLGASHEITLAYRFKNNNYYDYSRDEELAGLFTSGSKRKKKKSSKKAVATTPETTITQPEEESIPEDLFTDTREKERIAAKEKARQEAEAQARIASEEKARQEAEAQARIASEEKARQEAETQARIVSEEKEVKETTSEIINPTDAIGQQLNTLTNQTETEAVAQTKLLAQLESAVASKQQTLSDLKEENDLGEQGIFVAPKPFKSITGENEAIENLKINLDTVILRQARKIAQLEALLIDRRKTFKNKDDATNLHFQTTLATLKSEQNKAIKTREALVSSLTQIAVATAFERKRRIKRASYTNEEARYSQDRARLAAIKQNTPKQQTPLAIEDLDFGEERNTNIQILKNVSNTESGYYLVVAVHNDSGKRDDFLTKVVASGKQNIDFFYDVNTSKYYIYTQKFDSIQEANAALNLKGNNIYEEKMSLLKIEN